MILEVKIKTSEVRQKPFPEFLFWQQLDYKCRVQITARPLNLRVYSTGHEWQFF